MRFHSIVLSSLVAALFGLTGAVPSEDNPFAEPPPQARATSAPVLWNDVQVRGDFGENAVHRVDPEARQLTLTAGARPTPIYVPLADPQDAYSACFWGIGNAGQTVYKVFVTAPSNNNQWEAYLLEGPTGASLYHDQLTTRVNGTLGTYIASATCKYKEPIEQNTATADCNWMAVIDPPTTTWYRYARTVITATYTPDLCNLAHNTKTKWDIGSGNGTFDPNPDSVPQSWAVRKMEDLAMSSIWAIGLIGVVSVLGLRFL